MSVPPKTQGVWEMGLNQVSSGTEAPVWVHSQPLRGISWARQLGAGSGHGKVTPTPCEPGGPIKRHGDGSQPAVWKGSMPTGHGPGH